MAAVVKPFLYLATASAPGAADKTLFDIRAPSWRLDDEPGTRIIKLIVIMFQKKSAWGKDLVISYLPRVAVIEGGGVRDPVSPRGLGAAVTVPKAP